MRGIWCLICRFEPILSDSTLTGGYPIIPTVAAIDLSLQLRFRRFNRVRIALWGILLDASPAELGREGRGSAAICRREGKNIPLISGSCVGLVLIQSASQSEIPGKLLPSCVYSTLMLEIPQLDSSPL